MFRSRLAKFVPAAWLIFLALFGGASRYDEWQQIVIIAASAGLLLAVFWVPDWSDLRAKRALWLFLVAIGLSIAVQLVPMPPSIWSSLPGREPFAVGETFTGLERQWRPLSLTPDLTWASLFSLLPIAATLSVAPSGRSSAIMPLIWAMISIFSVATCLGVAQSLGADGLTLYKLTNVGSAVGLFANRNHHAIFLTLAFPVLAYIIASPRPQFGSAPATFGIGLCAAAVYAVAIVQAGSRSGLVLGALMLGAILTAFALKFFAFPPMISRRLPSPNARLARSRPFALVGLAATGIVIALLFVVVRSSAFDRLAQFDVTYDSRAQILPVLFEMATSFAPFGSGYGSFATVFRHFEPFDALRYTYLNQAHNDTLQVLIEGGVVGVVLMGGAIFALVRQTLLIARAPRSNDQMIGIVGCLMVLALFLASIVDYPLRTPLLAGMLIFAAVFTLRPIKLGSLTKSQLPSEGPQLR